MPWVGIHLEARLRFRKESKTRSDSTGTLGAACTLAITPGGVPYTLYKVYRYVPPQRVWFLSRFGLKTGIDFEHFGLKLGMVIGGTFTKAYKLIFLPRNQGE